MAVSGIQGQLLEVTVVGCLKLRDTEWFSRQDPYVCLEYGSNKFRTRTCTDGGKNPTFQEKFVFTLIEGLREINVVVWNSNTMSYDDFIGNGKIQLHRVLSSGYDDSSWPIQTKNGRHAGEVRLIMHYNKPASVSHTCHSPYGYVQPPPSPYGYPPQPQPAYAPPQPQPYYPQPPPAYPQSAYPPPPSTYPPSISTYPPQPQWGSSPYPPPQGSYGAYPPRY